MTLRQYLAPKGGEIVELYPVLGEETVLAQHRTSLDDGNRPATSPSESMLRYAITDRARATLAESAQEEALLRQAEDLAESGVDFVQLREKDLQASTLASLARKLLAVLRSHANPPKLLINSRADVAVAVGADGVHLTSTTGSLSPSDIRRLYAGAGLPEPIVSVSCHALSDIPPARDAAVTMILFGPVFEKVVSTHEAEMVAEAVVAEGIGLNLLHLACATAGRTPVFALGGVTPENAASCLAAGAAGIAAIRMFIE